MFSLTKLKANGHFLPETLAAGVIKFALYVWINSAQEGPGKSWFYANEYVGGLSYGTILPTGRVYQNILYYYYLFILLGGPKTVLF